MLLHISGQKLIFSLCGHAELWWPPGNGYNEKINKLQNTEKCWNPSSSKTITNLVRKIPSKTWRFLQNIVVELLHNLQICEGSFCAKVWDKLLSAVWIHLLLHISAAVKLCRQQPRSFLPTFINLNTINIKCWNNLPRAKESHNLEKLNIN